MSKGNKKRRRELGLLPEPARCLARKRDGTPCKMPPINGAAVCRMHGGAAGQVKRKAAERIALASDIAAERLVAMMQDPKVPHAVQLSAAKDLLDRAGLNAKTTIELDLPWQQLLISGITATVDEAAAGVRQFYNSEESAPLQAGAVIEGVDYAVSDRDYGWVERPGLTPEKVDYGPAPVHDPDYPPEPRAGQPSSDRPRTRQARRR